MPNIQLQAVAGELPKLPANQDWKAVEDGLVATSPEYAAALKLESVKPAQRSDVKNLSPYQPKRPVRSRRR